MKKYLDPEIIISNLYEKRVLVELDLFSNQGNDIENNIGEEELLPKD